MVATGYMHNYLRMYWCKRLIEWSPSPATAFQWALALNNKFELDGRDENGYMGVAWCFGHHDRPFAERPIFGTVRCMTMKGLEGKFDMVRYRTRVRSKCVAAVKDEPRLRDLLPDACFDPVTSSGSATRGTGKRSSAAPPSRDIRGFFSAASTAPPAEKRPRFSSPLSSNSTGAPAAGSAAGK